MIPKVRITQNKREDKKIAFVKAMKNLTGFGLKEAKDECDRLYSGFTDNSKSTIEITLGGPFGADYSREDRILSIKKFIKDINENCTGDYTVNGGIEWEREKKLLSLGVGSDSDYADFITKVIMFRSQSDIESFIIDILSTQDRKSLEKIYNKLIKEEDGERLDTL